MTDYDLSKGAGCFLRANGRWEHVWLWNHQCRDCGLIYARREGES